MTHTTNLNDYVEAVPKHSAEKNVAAPSESSLAAITPDIVSEVKTFISVSLREHPAEIIRKIDCIRSEITSLCTRYDDSGD